MMDAIILAGGLGTRLRPFTELVPKPMLRVGNRPFLEYVLDFLADGGAGTVCLAVSYRHQMIKDHFGSRYRGLNLTYSIEPKPLGTGGAIRQALAEISGANVIVANGDTLFLVDLCDLWAAHLKSSVSLTISVRPVAHAARYGTV
ncbi:MAG TPA: D-glycero-D-manno-heptose 1-phosphate guanosyltransferase, partial [Candidatus Acetothermia bacterium]|nr:D-glycero-D-manno-heptose 1-phosphate guanosyltransferase [Candidatus Acetothermia bacterium]